MCVHKYLDDIGILSEKHGTEILAQNDLNVEGSGRDWDQNDVVIVRMNRLL